MKAGSPFDAIHSAMAHFCSTAAPEITYSMPHFGKDKNKKPREKTRRLAPYEAHVFAMFQQTWGSTALGFGGMGGATMTTAYVTIFESDHHHGFYAVYFGGRFAYLVERPNEQFFDDVRGFRMADVKSATRYARKEKEGGK